MDPIQALLRFLQHELPFLPLPSEDQVLKIVSAEGLSALKARFASQAAAVKALLIENHWFPTPSTRVADGRWHTLIASVLYYIARIAVSEHGLDNLVAGALQGFYMQSVLAQVDPSLYNAPGREDELIAAVGNALAELICSAGPEAGSPPTPAPAAKPTPEPTPAPKPTPDPAPPAVPMPEQPAESPAPEPEQPAAETSAAEGAS